MGELTIKPIATALGAEVTGVDLGGNLREETVAAIRQALLDHCVIFFRDQKLDVDQHKRLARRFGDIFLHPNFNTGDHDPEVVTIVRKPGDTHVVGEEEENIGAISIIGIAPGGFGEKGRHEQAEEKD